MADTPIQFEFAAGETLTVKMFADGSDTILNGAGDAATEATNRHGTYTILFAESNTGLLQGKVFASAVHVGTFWVYVVADDTTTYFAESSRRVALALPNAAADAAGGLPVSDAGGLDLDAKLANTNEVTAARMAALTDWIDGGRLDLLLDAIKAVTDNMPDSGALTAIIAAIAAVPTTAEIEASLVNEGDSTALLQAIADKIAGDLTVGDITAAANASAVRAELATELARLDVAVSTRLASAAVPIVTATGTAAAASAGATSLTVTGLDMDASKYKRQYLVLEEGDGKGFASEILASSTGTTLNLKDELPAAVTLNDTVRIVGKAR